jgi:quinol monooxygenase YgiN
MKIEWLVPVGQVRSITIALHSLSADTRTLHGCAGSSVSTEIAKDATLRYVEEWQTEDDLRDHLRSEAFGRLIGLVEAATKQPHIEFILPGGTRGLDYAAEVRRSQK